jgi:hypothetical protein
MIRTLRVRHRFAALGLALALPPACALALAARNPEPRNPELQVEPPPPEGARSVELDSRGELVPDALVYWSPGPGSDESLAPDSVFLGTLPADAVRRFIPPGSGPGRVAVYSLAWQRVVRSIPVAAETPR